MRTLLKDALLLSSDRVNTWLSAVEQRHLEDVRVGLRVCEHRQVFFDLANEKLIHLRHEMLRADLAFV